MIELTHVSKVFEGKGKKEGVHAVKDVSLSIRDGEIFGIIGFSGAGKSTLVRCINLLERPTEGGVLIDGQDITKLSEKELRGVRRKIGMIFQHFNLMRSRTVYGNIEFALRHSGLSKPEKDKKIRELLELVGLSEKTDAYPSQLSGGQKQRVAIARALANDPKVLLCDEATSALDPQTTASILKLLNEVNRRLGLTIIIITHQMDVVKDICDRVAVMENGCVVEEGETIRIFERPQQPVTKDFIETATHISKIHELVQANSPLCELPEGGKLLILNYSSGNTKDAVISQVSRKFNVDASIIFGNVEVLKDLPFGKLVVKLSGKPEQVEEAIAYFQDAGIDTEVIKG